MDKVIESLRNSCPSSVQVSRLKRRQKVTHGELVTACFNLLEALRLSGKPVIAAKTATVTARLMSGRYLDTGRPGHADITACISGSYVQIECKTRQDTQHDNQRDMQQYVTLAGGTYLIGGLAVVREYLRSRGLL